MPESAAVPTPRPRTEAQRLAARLNGARSRGPVTPEGKARVAQNAIKHGLNARRVVLQGEIPECWDAFLEALTEEWQPQTVTEIQLIHDLAAARWRLNRLLDIETSLTDLEMEKQENRLRAECPGCDMILVIAEATRSLYQTGALESIQRHEARLRRTIDRTLDRLVAIQQVRTAAPAEAREVAPVPESGLPAAQQSSVRNKPEHRQQDGAEKLRPVAVPAKTTEQARVGCLPKYNPLEFPK